MSKAEMLERPGVPAMDALLGKVFPVLDKGHIRVIDYMGDEAAICQAARVSYGKGTKTISEDIGLLRYLMRKRHTTPFEMCELKLHVKIPMDCWRQMIRHRTASVNEYSTRYSEAIDDKQATLPGQWRLQSGSNKQGSDGVIPEEVGKLLTLAEEEMHEHAAMAYQARLEAGVAREQARKDLPLSTYTMAYWKVDVHNLLHYLGLRMDSHAQLEIRSYADVIGKEILAIWLPNVWQAFLNYRLHAMTLSQLDQVVISKILGDCPASATQHARDYGWLKEDYSPKKNSRERQEFEVKAKELGVLIPW